MHFHSSLLWVTAAFAPGVLSNVMNPKPEIGIIQGTVVDRTKPFANKPLDMLVRYRWYPHLSPMPAPRFYFSVSGSPACLPTFTLGGGFLAVNDGVFDNGKPANYLPDRPASDERPFMGWSIHGVKEKVVWKKEGDLLSVNGNTDFCIEYQLENSPSPELRPQECLRVELRLVPLPSPGPKVCKERDESLPPPFPKPKEDSPATAPPTPPQEPALRPNQTMREPQNVNNNPQEPALGPDQTRREPQNIKNNPQEPALGPDQMRREPHNIKNHPRPLGGECDTH